MTGGPARRPAAGLTAVPRWRRSRGSAAAGIAVILLVGAALVLSRLDLALLALPLLVALARSVDDRPEPGRSVGLTLTSSDAGADGEVTFALDVAATSVAAIVLRLTVLGGDSHELVISTTASSGAPAGRLPVAHSGPQELLAIDVRLLGVDAATASRPLGPLVVSRVLAPRRTPVGHLPLPRRLHGLTGPHDSVRAGDGGEFRDVHLFAPGDRLRRIDWKATARRGRGAAELYVRRTDALADATAIIAIDTRDDVGEQIALWSANPADRKGVSTLDLAREAAASLAESYIRAGDRVGLQDLCNPHRTIPHAGGARHLWRLARAIELTGPMGVGSGRLTPAIIPAGALVHLLSALLDDEPVGLALRLRGRGHRVILVDTLPAPRFDGATRYERLAHRVLAMERRDRIDTLRAGGVELLRWSTDGGTLSREAQLRRLGRASAPAAAGGRR